MTYPELISPAGNLKKAQVAMAFGADAIYAGLPDFSLRTRINQFSLADLTEAKKLADSYNKKVYITLNILAHNYHLSALAKHVAALKKLNVDGIIASDPGVIQIIRKNWPQARIHLSTQANCTNWQTALFWYRQGVKRVVLGREVSLAEVLEIRKRVPRLELEVFVHGAMCMAYSGRCFLSRYFTNKSANLGDCTQPCRWEYQISSSKPELDQSLEIQAQNHPTKLELVQERHGSYILNSADLCLIKRLGELQKAGISAFKIEGRAKSIYYLANVIGAYREAIDLLKDKNASPQKIKNKLNYYYRELESKLVHRGYTEGFMFGQGELAQNLANSHNISEWEFCGQILDSEPKAKNKFLNLVSVHNSLKLNDELEILSPSYAIIKLKLKKILDAKTKEELSEAHGGQAKNVLIETAKPIAKLSVIRRKI